MMLHATLNNISAISWRLVLLVEETGVSGENHCETFSHNVKNKIQVMINEYSSPYTFIGNKTLFSLVSILLLFIRS
jgi:hypothetical protein